MVYQTLCVKDTKLFRSRQKGLIVNPWSNWSLYFCVSFYQYFSLKQHLNYTNTLQTTQKTESRKYKSKHRLYYVKYYKVAAKLLNNGSFFQ